MSLGLVVLEKKLFTRTRMYTPQSDDIKNSLSLGVVGLEEKLFTQKRTPQSDAMSD